MLPEPSEMPPVPAYPPCPAGLPSGFAQQGRYRARFATTAAELDAILRLRFEVFNLELREGLESSYETGRDEDRFDSTCHHLLVEDTKNGGAIVGTYRMQTNEMAAEGGFYSAGEFDLSALPPEVAGGAVEVGRACIAREHRNRQTLFLLWKGLALYMRHNRKRFLFGCCSLTSQDGCEGLAALAHLEAKGLLHPGVRVLPLPGFECACDRPLPAAPADFELPVLFRTYLRYGALVCGPPAIDREFKTIDFLVLFDVDAMDRQTYELYFH
jgi:putative hemolysin